MHFHEESGDWMFFSYTLLKSKLIKLVSRLFLGSGIIFPWIILKTSHVVWSTGSSGSRDQVSVRVADSTSYKLVDVGH